MFIKAEYTKKSACYTAVLDAISDLEPGDTITIDGMSCEDRTIDIEVVKALIHTTRDELGKNFQKNETEDVREFYDGWNTTIVKTRRLHVTCTGFA